MTSHHFLTAVQPEPGGTVAIHTEHCPAIPTGVRRFDLDATTTCDTIVEVWSDELDDGDVDLVQATRNTTFHTCTGLTAADASEDTWCQHERDNRSLCGNDALPGSTRCGAHQDDGQAGIHLSKPQSCGSSRSFR